MAKFRGDKNLNLGGEKPWAVAQYDHASREYVIELSGKDASKFRAVADDYGFREDAAPRHAAAEVSEDA